MPLQVLTAIIYAVILFGGAFLFWFYGIGRFLIRILSLLTRFEVTGKENVPPTGPLIVVANHVSVADPALLSITIPRKMVFMAKEELFHYGPLNYLVRGFGAFPVKRGSPATQAFKEAERFLSQGLALAIFPEGMRSRTGTMKEALPGVALIAYRSKAVILPVGISGTEVIKGFGWIFRRPRVKMVIGKPFILKSYGEEPDKSQLKETMDDIMRHIAELLPPEYRGRWRKTD